ncbi:integrase [Arthrobacter silviterrae]|uniref:Tyrosine-type recombinase/integrase n=1 Tax=Arthrobacter silviterrae TaxID=2026658 RepID=A0ABX0DM27_9MICC|nr:site-specific integrase [Arthrobacter silviterrae]MDQ0277473.1 integrase [Arthrobacter silviterrae]NGN85262.1 tyrosine-type recombinase/integrase [Arthrobacter silviterrae]
MENKIDTVADLVGAIIAEMERLNYKPSVIKQYRIVWDKLCAHSGAMPVGAFSIEHGMEFLEDVLHIRSHPLSEATSHRWMKAIYLLSDFNRTGVLTLRKPGREFVFNGAAAAPFQAYVASMAAKGMSAAHIRNSSVYLERLATFLDHAGLEDISGLEPVHVNGFVESLAVYELPTIYHTVCALRSVLGYLRGEGMSPLVPRIRYTKKARIPSAYSREEVEQMVAAIDRGSPRGKRDLVLILLAARLGLRASDIAGLQFSNLRWEQDAIEIIQHKTSRVLALPLLNDVGEAIIDYLHNARPHSDSEYVFLKLHGPCEPMQPTTIHAVVHTRLKAAGVAIPQGKKHGPHALRHSLASALLEKKVPLPAIAEALGHADTDSTAGYLKIDLGQLRGCALDVPGLYQGYLDSLGGGGHEV